MDFEKWKELIHTIFVYAMILTITIVVAATFSQLLVNGAYVNSIVNAYKRIGQILPFS